MTFSLDKCAISRVGYDTYDTLSKPLTGRSDGLCSLSVPKDSWEMVGKKKSLSGPKESIQADTGEDGKENRDKGGERDVARRRGGAPRRGRGASRGRECESLQRSCSPLVFVLMTRRP